MEPLYNHPVLKEKRKALRKNQSRAESFLWRHLRYKRIQGIKFYRQFSIGPYILDFYCPKWRLAIELDGGQHQKKDNREYDWERTAFLNNQNVKVIRFWNEEVLNNPEAVAKKIVNSCGHDSPAIAEESVAPSYCKRGKMI